MMHANSSAQKIRNKLEICGAKRRKFSYEIKKLLGLMSHASLLLENAFADKKMRNWLAKSFMWN